MEERSISFSGDAGWESAITPRRRWGAHRGGRCTADASGRTIGAHRDEFADDGIDEAACAERITQLAHSTAWLVAAWTGTRSRRMICAAAAKGPPRRRGSRSMKGYVVQQLEQEGEESQLRMAAS